MLVQDLSLRGNMQGLAFLPAELARSILERRYDHLSHFCVKKLPASSGIHGVYVYP